VESDKSPLARASTVTSTEPSCGAAAPRVVGHPVGPPLPIKARDECDEIVGERAAGVCQGSQGARRGIPWPGCSPKPIWW
jgi:hypothetical protein